MTSWAASEVLVRPVPLGRLAQVLPPSRADALDAMAARMRQQLKGRTVWNVSSTAQGGRVAEMPQALVGYGLGAGVDTRWLVLAADRRFFTGTKRIHNLVNTLQSYATVVVQKSLAEGFGLTVTEPMWKARPVVASAVGGITDQIQDGVSGLLLSDPTDLRAFVRLASGLFDDPDRRSTLGTAARARVADRFLGDRHLMQYGALFDTLGTGS